jgi:hypothetical protein
MSAPSDSVASAPSTSNRSVAVLSRQEKKKAEKVAAASALKKATALIDIEIVEQIGALHLKQIQGVALIGALESVHEKSARSTNSQYVQLNNAFHGDHTDKNSIGMIDQVINYVLLNDKL